VDRNEAASRHERWGHLRFLVIGRLLLKPPPKGKLLEALRALAEQSWPHPETGESVTFGVSTIQRWFHAARGKSDATGVLRRKVRKDLGIQNSLHEATQQALRELQYTPRTPTGLSFSSRGI
jgi:putative transposase